MSKKVMQEFSQWFPGLWLSYLDLIRNLPGMCVQLEEARDITNGFIVTEGGEKLARQAESFLEALTRALVMLLFAMHFEAGSPTKSEVLWMATEIRERLGSMKRPTGEMKETVAERIGELSVFQVMKKGEFGSSQGR